MSLEELNRRFTDHVKTVDQRFDALLVAQEGNTQAITALVEDTREIVQIHKDFQGATRLGTSVQKFGLWLLKWPLIGMGLYTAFNWIVDHLPG